ncbi:MAG: hypothetical protein IJF92_05780 [Bacilli bacterium]|nr:hypothetical protein [Bacilli bacterium]
MKLLKQIGKFLINNILFVLVFIFILSLNLRYVVNRSFINKIVVNKMSDNIVTILDDNFKNLNDDDISDIKQEIQNNKKVNSIVEKYTDTTFNYLVDGNAANINITNDIKSIIKENKSDIETKYNITISEEEIDKAVNKFDKLYNINDYYKKTIKKTSKSLTKEQKQTLKIYNIITSIKFILIIGILIIITIVVIGLYKKSFYKWLKNISISGIVSSVIVSILFIVFTLYINSYINTINLNILKSILIPIYSFVISIILLIIYVIFNKQRKIKC